MNRSEFYKLFGQSQAQGADSANQAASAQAHEQLAKLQSYLQGQNQQAQIQGVHAADLDSQQQAISRAKQLQDDLSSGKPGHKYNIGISKEGASISEADAMPPLGHQLAQDRLKQQKMENLSKRYENLNDFNSSLQDINKLSDADGKGGILSNPAAQLPGTGKFVSALPDSAMGVAELLGAAPKGASEMRKSLSRLQLGYARALGGARGVNPAMIQKEREAMGYIASGDPELVKKGILSLTENVKNHYRTIQSGYTPDVTEAVHHTLGGNPIDQYGGLPEAGPAGAPVRAPKTAPATAGNPPLTAPQAPAPQMDDIIRKAQEEMKRRAGGV